MYLFTDFIHNSVVIWNATSETDMIKIKLITSTTRKYK